MIWAHGQAGVFQPPHIEIRSFLLFKTPQQTENFLFWEQAVYFNYYYSLLTANEQFIFDTRTNYGPYNN